MHYYFIFIPAHLVASNVPPPPQLSSSTLLSSRHQQPRLSLRHLRLQPRLPITLGPCRLSPLPSSPPSTHPQTSPPSSPGPPTPTRPPTPASPPTQITASRSLTPVLSSSKGPLGSQIISKQNLLGCKALMILQESQNLNHDLNQILQMNPVSFVKQVALVKIQMA